MELNDIMIVGTHPVTLRMVLGLMEDAESSLETYRWATPALMHSIYTNDRILSKQVEEIFKRKDVHPYEPYNNDKDSNQKSDAQYLRQRITDKNVIRSKAKMALEELMMLKDAKGMPLFNQQNHWWAVFRLFVDRQVGDIRENRYKVFIDFIGSLELDSMNAPLDETTLNNISQEIYRFPYSTWESKVPEDASARWLTAFNRMNMIGDKLLHILIKKGF